MLILSLRRLLPIAVFVIFISSCDVNPPLVILYQEGSDPKVEFAAKEIRRYVYLRTGQLAELATQPISGSKANTIILKVDTQLGQESYSLHTMPESSTGTGPTLLIHGADPIALLYGTYTFVEKLGVRFYLHGDVIPDKKIKFEIPEIHGEYTPLFNTRGINPFHDFPEGPDWWMMDDYKAYLNQMVKMRMNFIGFHTYPEGSVGPEPLIWIGPKDQVNEDGTVKSAYRSRHFMTSSGTWGSTAMKTSDYSHGLGHLFADDSYGPSYLQGIWGWPEGKEMEIQVFNRSAAFFGEVFDYARSLGIKVCIGTETPLVVPSQVKERFPDLSSREYYEGMFTWIKRNYDIDYYWFWTPEGWTWGGNTDEDIQTTKDDLLAAGEAVDAVGNPFQLATCGWVLGPAQDRAMFDQFLPKEWPMSCINQQVGFTPVDPGFSRVKDRSLWAIPWMEDDPAMTIPQLWAGRMRADAADAYAYGCDGLIGIHWRTRPLSMNVSALAKAAWTQVTDHGSRITDHGSQVTDHGSRITDHGSQITDPDSNFVRPWRDLPTDDFYQDWALAEFGPYTADSMAKVFIQLDGQEKNINAGGGRVTRLPRPADWFRGPGGVVPDTTPWDTRQTDYSFIETMESWRDMVRRPGHLERFDYWMNQFKYLRAYGKFACTLGQINALITKLDQNDPTISNTATDDLIKLRIQLMEDQTEALKYLLAYVSTPGDLGTIANWQQHIYQYFIDDPGRNIQDIINDSLPPACWPSTDTLQIRRIIVTTQKTAINKGDNLTVQLTVFGFTPERVVVKYRMLGTGGYKELALSHILRGIYTVDIPSDTIPDDFEYYVEVRSENSEVFRWPSSAGKINHSVVVW